MPPQGSEKWGGKNSKFSKDYQCFLKIFGACGGLSKKCIFCRFFVVVFCDKFPNQCIFFAPRATSDTTKRVCVVRSALVSLAKRSWCALTQTAIVFTNTGRHFYHLVKRFVTREAMFLSFCGWEKTLLPPAKTFHKLRGRTPNNDDKTDAWGSN